MRAVHQVLRHAVMIGQRESGADVAVAAVAQVWLLLFQQAVVQPAIIFGQARDREEILLGDAQARGGRVFDHQVSRMAFVAGDPVLDVRRAAEFLLVAAALMALHAALGVALRILAESEDELLCRGRLRVVALRRLHRVGVRLAPAVTHFAAGDGFFGRRRRILGRRSRILGRRSHRRVLGFRILLIFRPMAGAAPLGAGIDITGRGRYGPSADRGGLRGRRARLRREAPGEDKDSPQKLQYPFHAHPSLQCKFHPLRVQITEPIGCTRSRCGIS